MQPILHRRAFLRNSTLLGVGLAANSVLAVNLTSGVKKVKVGLVGCGGRGVGAIRNFMEACKILGIEAELVAVGDAFKEKAEGAGKSFSLPADRCYGDTTTTRKFSPATVTTS